LTLTGYYLGEAWTTFSDEASSAFTLVSVVIAAIVGIAGIWYVRRKKRTTPKEKQ
jgi:LPXTG-motif cell wall-anchored protein